LENQSHHEHRKKTRPTSSNVNANLHSFFVSAYPAKSFDIACLTHMAIVFAVPVVQRTLLGTDGFNGSAALAVINGGHPKAPISPSQRRDPDGLCAD
jgi:hypothetical protein